MQEGGGSDVTPPTPRTAPETSLGEPRPGEPRPPGEEAPTVAEETPRRRRTGMMVGGIVALVVVGGVVAYLLLRGGGQAIETPNGTLLIEDVKLADSWPVGCTPSPTDLSCIAPQPGFKILAVVLVPEETPPEGLLGPGAPSPQTGAVYVTDSTGDRLEVAASSFDVGGARFVLMFTPSSSATGFVLHHPQNDPIELDV